MTRPFEAGLYSCSFLIISFCLVHVLWIRPATTLAITTPCSGIPFLTTYLRLAQTQQWPPPWNCPAHPALKKFRCMRPSYSKVTVASYLSQQVPQHLLQSAPQNASSSSLCTTTKVHSLVSEISTHRSQIALPPPLAPKLSPPSSWAEAEPRTFVSDARLPGMQAPPP